MSISHAEGDELALIRQNWKAIFELECLVKNNKDQMYLARDLVMENRATILRNYTAAFQGNSHLSNGNTDAMFRNRKAVIRSSYIGDNKTKNVFIEALSNQVKLDYLDHRSRLNEMTTAVTSRIADVNTMLRQINKEIMSMNEEVVEYNATRIAENAEMIERGVQGLGTASPGLTARLILANEESISRICTRACGNTELLAGMLAAEQEIRPTIDENALQIAQRRIYVEENAEAIRDNMMGSALKIFQN